MSKKTSLYGRTTTEEHDLADQLLEERSEESVSRMVVALIIEDWERRHPEVLMELLPFDLNGREMVGTPIRIAGNSIFVSILGPDAVEMQCVAAHQASQDDFQRAWKYLCGKQ